MRHRSFVRLAAGVALALAAGLGAAVAADLWAQLGVKETEARGQVGYALTSGHVPYYLAAKAFKAASPAVRASLVTEGVKWAKVYVASAEFKAAYLSLRDGHKPGMPAAKGTPEQRVKAMLDDQRKQLEETKKNLTQMPPDVRKQMEPALAQMEAQIQKTAGDAAMLGMLKQGFAAEAKEDEERYRQNVAAWQKAYPPTRRRSSRRASANSSMPAPRSTTRRSW